MLSALISDGTLEASGTSGLLGVTKGWIEPLRGGAASPTHLPRLLSFGVGSKETGRSLGRWWWVEVGVGELQMT